MFGLIICVLGKDNLARILNPKSTPQENTHKILHKSFKEFLVR